MPEKLFTMTKQTLVIMEDNKYSTLSIAVEDLKRRGYTLDFEIESDGLHTLDSNQKFKPENIKIDEFHRFEGMTNPGDMSIIYALSTNSGEKGTIIDSYGVEGSQQLSEFLLKIDKNEK